MKDVYAFCFLSADETYSALSTELPEIEQKESIMQLASEHVKKLVLYTKKMMRILLKHYGKNCQIITDYMKNSIIEEMSWVMEDPEAELPDRVVRGY